MVCFCRFEWSNAWENFGICFCFGCVSLNSLLWTNMAMKRHHIIFILSCLVLLWWCKANDLLVNNIAMKRHCITIFNHVCCWLARRPANLSLNDHSTPCKVLGIGMYWIWVTTGELWRHFWLRKFMVPLRLFEGIFSLQKAWKHQGPLNTLPEGPKEKQPC